MFGIVIWKNDRKNSGLIWCDDSKSLAMFDGSEKPSRIVNALRTGDACLFDHVTVGTHRFVKSFDTRIHGSVDIENTAADLMRALAGAPAARGATGTAEICYLPNCHARNADAGETPAPAQLQLGEDLRLVATR